MAMLASEIITEAREFHTSFDELRHPTTMLLRALHRGEARFVNEVANIAPNAMAVDLVYDEAAIAAGILGGALTIPVFHSLLPTAILVTPNGIFPVSIIEDEQSGGGRALKIRLVGRSLYIAQPTAFQDEMPTAISDTIQNYSYFKDATALRITYVPRPEVISTIGATLVTPDEARMYLQGELVKFMANRTPALGSDKTALMADAMMMQDDVISNYAHRSGGETRWYVSDVG